ncbi:MAG: 4Fe-4S ferredoxin [Kiritimatiellales bacterium]|nr:4Fe-4S ferredoxin [Kiritimatiellota bacterium]MBL7016558.1 4Fe-4S ferredoxin [Kiritimatiellales bacterium]
MKRNIIQIDEELCNGCGNCVIGCAEGALQMVNGKAKVVNEKFCDGFGDCIGVCPTGALEIIERDADEYDEDATREHIRRLGGDEAVKRFDEAAVEHTAEKTPNIAPSADGGCPGMKVRFDQNTAAPAAPATQASGQALPSELNQWPTQLHLVPTEASFFKNRELVVLSTCAPSASPDVNWRFVRGRAIVIACPKLDRTEGYLEKLARILKVNGIPKVIIVRMEVPCCGGLTTIVKRAAEVSGRTDLIVEEAIIGLNGDLVKIVEI